MRYEELTESQVAELEAWHVAWSIGQRAADERNRLVADMKAKAEEVSREWQPARPPRPEDVALAEKTLEAISNRRQQIREEAIAEMAGKAEK